MLDAAEAEGYEYAMLFSEIDPAFYEHLDFVPVPLVESRIEVVRKGGAPAMLVRAGDERDIPAIAEMSATRASGARFALDRSEDWIRYGIGEAAAARRARTAGPARGRVPGHRRGPPGGGLRDLDHRERAAGSSRTAGDRDPSGARLGAMLQVMLARTPHLEAPEIRAWLPTNLRPPQLSAIATTPTSEVLMIRPLQDRTLPLPPLDAADVAYWRLDYF